MMSLVLVNVHLHVKNIQQQNNVFEVVVRFSHISSNHLKLEHLTMNMSRLIQLVASNEIEKSMRQRER